MPNIGVYKKWPDGMHEEMPNSFTIRIFLRLCEGADKPIFNLSLLHTFIFESFSLRAVKWKYGDLAIVLEKK